MTVRICFPHNEEEDQYYERVSSILSLVSSAIGMVTLVIALRSPRRRKFPSRLISYLGAVMISVDLVLGLSLFLPRHDRGGKATNACLVQGALMQFLLVLMVWTLFIFQIVQYLLIVRRLNPLT